MRFYTLNLAQEADHTPPVLKVKLVRSLRVVFILFCFISFPEITLSYQKQQTLPTHGFLRNPEGSPVSSGVQCACSMEDTGIDSNATMQLIESVQPFGSSVLADL